jgi:hypothetical protein
MKRGALIWGKMVVTLLIFGGGMVFGYFAVGRHISLVERAGQYAVGIYTGDSLFSLHPAARFNPVLRASQVTDVPAEFVADPFLIRKDSTWYLFVEVMNGRTHQGDLACAISQDGKHFRYDRIVLDEPYHLSYPYVFKAGDTFYLLPESHDAYGVWLYEAKDFPHAWVKGPRLLTGNYFDSSILFFQGRWWIFTSDRNDMLHLFYADSLKGPYREHPRSPLIAGDYRIARCGGRVIPYNDHVVRFTQDCQGVYGQRVSAFEITRLTPTEYQERARPENPILKGSGRGWNSERMHHFDPHQLPDGSWIASADGVGAYLRFAALEKWGHKKHRRSNESGS